VFLAIKAARGITQKFSHPRGNNACLVFAASRPKALIPVGLTIPVPPVEVFDRGHFLQVWEVFFLLGFGNYLDGRTNLPFKEVSGDGGVTASRFAGRRSSLRSWLTVNRPHRYRQDIARLSRLFFHPRPRSWGISLYSSSLLLWDGTTTVLFQQRIETFLPHQYSSHSILISSLS